MKGGMGKKVKKEGGKEEWRKGMNERQSEDS